MSGAASPRGSGAASPRGSGAASPRGGASASARAADERARCEAQRQFERPFVLDAGAGTGKTTVLVARIVAWCTNPGWERAQARLAAAALAGCAPGDDEIAAEVLRRVVAITFTEAAAAEMAGRVGASLHELEAGQRPVGVDEAALPAPELRAPRARALVASLDQLAVRTIHAWCRRLLAAQPLEVGLHPRFEVDADGRRTQEAIRSVLERRLAEAYAGAGDPDHFALARDGVGPGELEAALLALSEAGVAAGALQQSAFTPDALRRLHDDVVAALQGALAAGVARLAEAPRTPTAAATARAAEQSLAVWGTASPADAAALAERVGRLGELWEPSTRERLRKWERSEFGKGEHGVVGDDPGELPERAGALARLLDHVLAIDPPRLERARRVLAPLLAEVEQQLRHRGVESFEALLRDTRELLVGSPSAARRVRGEIDQLLVDEFQDTDRVQCGILAALVLDVPAGERRPGLFLVGDPKQSIYGWRNADLAAYEDFVERVRRSGGEIHRLAVNFRSVKPILDEVDRLIEPVMQAAPRLQPPYERLEACDELRAAAGFCDAGRAAVEHWVSWGWDAQAGAPDPKLRAADAAELEARAVAAEIAELHRAHGVPWSHVALLFRALSDVEIYLAALRDAGVPSVVERDETFYQRREVLEASALVRCVLDPRDHVALLALLRSAWVGVPDAALLPLWMQRFPGRASALRGGDPWALAAARDAVHAAARALPAGSPGVATLPGWEPALLAGIEALDHLRGAARRDAPDEFVEKLRALFAPEPSEAARYLGLHRLANLDRFFRDLTAALEESGGDVGAVLANLRTLSAMREAEEGRPRDAADDAVHVLSIHKAKGLAFEHVYLLQTHKAGRGKPPPVRAAPGDAGLEYELFETPTPGFHSTARSRTAVEEAERVRTLYVALTRARRRLVICGARSASGSEKSGSHLQLLAQRAAGTPGLEGLMRDTAAAGASAADAHETRWVFPALRPAAAPAAPEAEEPLADPEALARELAALERARTAARAREARAFHGVASADKPSLVAETAAADGDPDRPLQLLPRDLALAVGTAVHGALEQLDPAADPRESFEASFRRAQRMLGALAAPGERAAAEERARELLRRFFAGPLFARLRALGAHVLARELPVLLAPEADGDGPVGFVAGAIDLLYRDPADGVLVVADYKTDAVEAAQLAERAAHYAGQGRIYTRAVQSALALAQPPRFELWFLHAGEVVPVEA